MYQFLNHHYEIREVESPTMDNSGYPVMLNDQTMSDRKQKVLSSMHQRGLDGIIIYADLEHSGNFEYLTGFVPRFEEACLVLHKNGEMYMLVGNENINKVKFSRNSAIGLQVPSFSLPNQPHDYGFTITQAFEVSQVSSLRRVGLVGWKLLREGGFDVPSFILEGVRSNLGNEAILTNETSLFIGDNGVRRINNANEIAHYEFGSSLASDCMLSALNQVKRGRPELRLGSALNKYGQKTSVVTIAATGERFQKANLYPTQRRVRLKDKISLTIGYKGGLSSRSGFAVNSENELPDGNSDYITKLVVPYFNSIVEWIENVKIGMTGQDVYQMIDMVLPQSEYHWHLCPGHLVSDEEWLASPIYSGSHEKVESGMLFQTDIIPSLPGFGGVSAESTLLVADAKLELDIRNEYPDLWERMITRKNYLKNMLGINLSEHVWPMASTLAYYRPFMLNHQLALVKVD